MIEAFKQFVKKKQLCFQSEKVLVAVSGGIDSVVLLDLFSKTKFKIALAHCNFSLRGAESDEDEQFVTELAAKYGVDFFVKKFSAKKFSDKAGLSIQEAARNLRYEWFSELAEKLDFNHIAVAHHFDDQTETFFINLFRGSGVSGLRGMPAKRGKIIRPLLFARREEIEQYASENKLNFREDSSNSSDKYLRNRIRHNILPEIENLSTNFTLALSNSLQFLAEDDFLLKQLVDEKKNSILITENKQIEILQSKLLALESPGVWLYYFLKDFGFKRQMTNEIVLSLLDAKVGKVYFSDSHQLLIDRNNLIIREKVDKMNHNRKWHLRKRDISFPLKLKPSVVDNEAGLKMRTEPEFAYFNFEKLKFPLVIRQWKDGDKFVPFGMKGSKLVSDFLIDNKVNRFEKEKIYVMLSGNEIIWVIGLRTSENFKVTLQTTKIYIVQLVVDHQTAELN